MPPLDLDALNERLYKIEPYCTETIWPQLNAQERAAFLLDSTLIWMANGKFHIWLQNYAEIDFEGPDLLARIAERGRSVDPELVDVLRWIAQWGQRVKDGATGVGLASVVPSVWEAVRERARPFLKAVIDDWPEDLDPSDAPCPDWHRQEIAASTDGPRYPQVSVAFTSKAKNCPYSAIGSKSHAIDVVAYALWKAGVRDDELDACYWDLCNATEDFPEACARWLRFDGDGFDQSSFDEYRRSLDPFSNILGIENSQRVSAVFVNSQSLDEVEQALGNFYIARIQPTAERSFAAQMRSALRQDCDAVLFQLTDMDPAEDQPVVQQASLVGFCFVIAGDWDQCEPFREAMTQAGRVLKSGRWY